MSEISKRLLELIQEKGLSYGEIAEKTCIPKSAVHRYASGDTPKIPLNRLEAMAKVLGVSAAYLMGWEEKDAEARRQEEQLKYALFSGDTEVTPEMWQEVKEFAKYVESKYSK